jgi:hypothetical protein
LALTLGTPDDRDRFGLHFAWNLNLGTQFDFRLSNFDEIPWTFGVNAIALVLFIYLFRRSGDSLRVKNAEPSQPATENAPEHNQS